MSGGSITVEAQHFHRALVHLCSVAPAKSTIPILSNILITQKSGTVRLLVTDLDIEVQLPIAPAAFDGELTACVEAHRLQNLFRNLESGSQAVLKLTDNGRLSVVSGRSRFVLPTLSEQDFPRMRDDDGDEVRMKISASQLLSIFQRLKFAQHAAGAKPVFQGMCLQPVPDGNADQFQMVAMDGRIAAREISEAEIEAPLTSNIISHQTISLLSKLMDGMGSKIHAIITKGRIKWSVGDWTITAKTIDFPYPDYRPALPDGEVNICIINARELERAVTRVSAMCDGDELKLKIMIEHGKMTLSSHESQAGEGHDEVACSWDGEPLDRVFSAKYLTDHMRVMPSQEVQFNIPKVNRPSGPSPICLYPVDYDGDYLSLITPMKF